MQSDITTHPLVSHPPLTLSKMLDSVLSLFLWLEILNWSALMLSLSSCASTSTGPWGEWRGEEGVWQLMQMCLSASAPPTH